MAETKRVIPEDLQQAYKDCSDPYVVPETLEWAITRDRSMQQFAKSMIERIADHAAALAAKDAEWVLRLASFRKGLESAGLHGHYNIFQQHFGEDADKGVEDLTAAQQQIVTLREALERVVWRERSNFPDNPYCVLCGVGQKWAAVHGHESNCALASPAPTQAAKGGTHAE